MVAENQIRVFERVLEIVFMNILRYKYIFLSFSGLLVLASITAISVWGLRLGIDFTGGSLMEVEFANEPPTTPLLAGQLEPLVGTVSVQPTGDKGVILRFRHVDEATHQAVLNKLQPLDALAQGAEEKRFDTIGPVIGKELRTRSLVALAVAIVAIILYIAWTFRHVSRPVSSWKYGVTAVIALIHDVAIPTGVFAVLGHFAGVEIDTLFITALLTILGFSVHDTIVVFDRIRENLRKLKSAEAYGLTVGRSVSETIGRSVNTSLTVLLVLFAIFFAGGSTTQSFALALIIGVLFGTYSSIFVASPLLTVWEQLTRRGYSDNT